MSFRSPKSSQIGCPEIPLESFPIGLGLLRISGQPQKGTEKGSFGYIRALGLTGPFGSEVYHCAMLVALLEVAAQTFRLCLAQSLSVKVILG